MKIVWSDQYEHGIEVIDNQHRRIVEYINQLDALKQDAASIEVVADVLQNLVDYTLSHFAFEEALMEEAGYAETAEHKITHGTFVRQLEGIRKRFVGGADVVDELTDLLQAWLLKHIMSDDTSYVPVVRAKILGGDTQHYRSWTRAAIERFFG